MTATKTSSAAAGAAEDKDTVKNEGGPAKVSEVADAISASLDAMRAELDAMRAQLAQQLAAAPAPAAPTEPSESQDPTHVVMLACGDAVRLPNTASTHHYCTEHEALVPVTGMFSLDPAHAA
jgi:hypothetical protein